MNLLTRSRLVAGLMVACTLLLGGVLFHAHANMVAAQDAMEEVDTLLLEVALLRTAAFDYVLHRETRPRVQAEAKFRRLDSLVSEAWLAVTVSEQREQERLLRSRIHAALGECEALFTELHDANHSPSFEERDRRTRDLFLLKSQALATAISNLHPILRHAVDRAQQRLDAAALSMGGVLLSMALAAVILLERYVLQPLDQLRRAAIAISKGETEVRLKLSRRDEIGQLSEALDQTLKQLAAANKELESFAYSVSHDLRAPLRAIDGFSRKVVERYGGQLDAEGRRQLQVVRDSAQRMGQLIDDLLAFSRMGRRELERQAVDMDAMARGVAAELVAAQPGRRIEIDIAPLPSAHGDAAMLRQVWFNLIANAVKFSGQRLSARVEIDGRQERNEVLYWVKDNGAGFDMQYAGKLFGVFQRLHRQDEFEGTGVGLAITQRILSRHGGRIWGEGQAQVGATFWFALPARSANESPSERSAQ